MDFDKVVLGHRLSLHAHLCFSSKVLILDNNWLLDNLIELQVTQEKERSSMFPKTRISEL